MAERRRSSNIRWLAIRLYNFTVYYALHGGSNYKSVYETLVCDHWNESYWAVLSCGTVYYAVQGGSNYKSVYETLVCDHSNESYWAVLSCDTVLYAVHMGY